MQICFPKSFVCQYNITHITHQKVTPIKLSEGRSPGDQCISSKLICLLSKAGTVLPRLSGRVGHRV